MRGWQKNALLRKLVVFVLVGVLAGGCRSHSTSQQTEYKLGDPPQAIPGATDSVEIVDNRPDWERRAFQGTISLVPMESLTPSPLQLLQYDIEQQACGLTDPPAKVHLELQSFRVVISKEDPFLPDDRNYSFPSEGSSGSGGGGWGGGGWDGAAFLGVCGAVLVAAVLTAGTFYAVIEFIHDHRHADSRPKEMTTDYARGVTCDARVTLVSEWPDGRRAEVPLREVVNQVEQESEFGPPYTTHDAVRDCVRGVCDQLARDWREKLLHPDSEVGTGKPVPVFSAYSGN